MVLGLFWGEFGSIFGATGVPRGWPRTARRLRYVARLRKQQLTVRLLAAWPHRGRDRGAIANGFGLLWPILVYFGLSSD